MTILIIGRDGNVSRIARMIILRLTIKLISSLHKTKSNFIKNTSIPITKHKSMTRSIRNLQKLLIATHFIFRNPFNSAPTFPNQSQWNASSDSDFDMASTSMTSGGGQAPKVNNHQKQAERMAEDESEFNFILFCRFL